MPKVIFNPVSEESLQLYPSSTEFFSHWQLNSGILSPNTISNSLNLGATATSSATVHLAGTVGENSFINTGKVGIGTTSPLTPLEVNGVIKSTRSGLPAQYLQLEGGDSTSIKLTAQSVVGAEKPFIIQNLSGETTPTFSNKIQFGVGTTSAPSIKMTIDYNGNVGIGTASPGTKLDVASSSPIVRLTDTRNITWTAGEVLGSLQAYTSDASDNGPHVAAQIDFFNDYPNSITSPTGAIKFLTSYATDANPSEKMRISYSGNVGIGTTSPTGKLHISGTTDDQQLIVQANATQTTNLQEWQNSSGTVLNAVGPTGNLGIGTAPTSTIRLYVSAINLAYSFNTVLANTDMDGIGASFGLTANTRTNAAHYYRGAYYSVSASNYDGVNSFTNTGYVRAMEAQALQSTSGTTGTLTAFQATLGNYGSGGADITGVISNLYGMNLNLINRVSATITNTYGINITLPDTGTMGTAYTFYCGGSTNTMTSKYGLYLGNFSGATNNYAIYTGAGLVRFGDNVSTTGDMKAATYHVGATAGVDGTFTTADSKTVTVTKGLITSII